MFRPRSWYCELGYVGSKGREYLRKPWLWGYPAVWSLNGWDIENSPSRIKPSPYRLGLANGSGARFPDPIGATQRNQHISNTSAHLLQCPWEGKDVGGGVEGPGVVCGCSEGAYLVINLV